MLKISKSGKITKNGVALKTKASPFFYGQGILTPDEQEIAREWVSENWGMVNDAPNRFNYDPKSHIK